MADPAKSSTSYVLHAAPGHPSPPPTTTTTQDGAPMVYQQHLPSTLSRPFRSRKNRPCDACRKAKTRCAIPGIGPPCVECQQTGKACTFDEQPPARKRAPKRPLSPSQQQGQQLGESNNNGSASHPGTTVKRQRTASSSTTGSAPLTLHSSPILIGQQHGLEALMHAATKERESQLRSHLNVRGGAPHLGSPPAGAGGPGLGVMGNAGVVPVSLSSGVLSSPGTALSSPSSSAAAAAAISHQQRALGDHPMSLDLSITPQLEPYAITVLLTDDLLPIGSNSYKQSFVGVDTTDIPPEGYIRQISNDRSKPQYIIFSKRPEHPPLQGSPSLIPHTFASLLSLIQPPPTIAHLLATYLKLSNPAFPLFIYPTPSPTPSSPPCILIQDELIQTKVSLAALSHSGPQFRAIARSARDVIAASMLASDHQSGGVMGGAGGGVWVGREDDRPPHLSAIATVLLEMSARDREVRRAAQRNYVLLAKTIAQAQLLGLHIDSTNWTIPGWEKDLRHVLWWGLRVHDAWMSFLNSRPAHVQADNSNVPIPSVRAVVGVTCAAAALEKADGGKTLAAAAAGKKGPAGRHKTSPLHSPTSPYRHHAQQTKSPETPTPDSSSPRHTHTPGSGEPGLASSSRIPSTSTSGDPATPPPLVSPSYCISAQSFVHLCKLSLLVSRLQSEVCTLVSASPESTLLEESPIYGRGVGREERVTRVVGIESDAAKLLDDARRVFGKMGWSASQGSAGPQNQGQGHQVRETGVVSLLFCLLGFRCMLRRISIELRIGLGSPFTPDPETLDMYAEAVQFICSLDGADFDSFWLTYAGHILSSLTSSLIRLSLATTTFIPGSTLSAHPTGTSQTLQASMRTNPLLLLSKLLNALHHAKQTAHWEMADAALQRAENVANCLRAGGNNTGGASGGASASGGGGGKEEYADVVAALEGRADFDAFVVQHPAYPGGNGMEQQQHQQHLQQQHPGQHSQQQQHAQQQHQHAHQTSHPPRYHNMQPTGGGGTESAQAYAGPNQHPHTHVHGIQPQPQQQQQQQQAIHPHQQDAFWETPGWNIDLAAFSQEWMMPYAAGAGVNQGRGGGGGQQQQGQQGQGQGQPGNANIDPAIRNANGSAWE